MSERRDFIKKAALGTIGISAVLSCKKLIEKEETTAEKVVPKNQRKPLIISTWNHGLPANEATWRALKKGKPVLDAIEIGMKIQ